MNPRPALDRTTDIDRIGFFGKLPTHGDFVATGLNHAVQEALDNWLQIGIREAQQAAGQNWEHQFRSMPAWRFIVERGLWGTSTIAGVMAPSRDRVGRSFPLVVASQLHDYTGDPRRLCLDDTWFIALEGIAETAGRRGFDLDVFTTSLKRLRTLRPGDFEFGGKRAKASPDTFWWRYDSQDRSTKGFRSGGPPRPRDFLALMETNDEDQDEPAQAPSSAPPEPAASVRPVEVETRTMIDQPEERVVQKTVAAPGRFRFSSSQASHPGTRLSINADSLLLSDQPALFAVADGIGDGNAAVDAGRTTINMLRDTPEQETFESLIQAVKGKLGQAHGLLQSQNVSPERATPCASLVAFAAHGNQFAMIWTGDARGYLVRDGMMRCLTRDHVAIGLRRALSRGIGLRGQLMPDVVADQLHVGDRFLLCSNPLARVLPERTIAEVLISLDLDGAAEALQQEALIADCRENFSAIVIDAQAV